MNQTETLVKSIVDGLQEKKGKRITTIDLRKLEGCICEYMVVCEGNTPTQVSALSDSVREFARKKAQDKPISTNGEQLAEWIGMDYGSVIVHIFLPDLRQYYKLEELWEDAIVDNIPDLD